MTMDFFISNCWSETLFGTFKNCRIVLNVTKDVCNVEGFDFF